jgi:hypothetical protein
MLRALLSALLGPPQESEAARELRKLGGLLRTQADDWRQARAASRELRERIELLGIELKTWRARLEAARESEISELAETAAERVGWYGGLVDQARRELDKESRRELFAHECLAAHRGRFLDLVSGARQRGERVDDFGLGAVYDDAPTGAVELPDDDGGEFVGRIIDRMRASVRR